MKQNLYSIVSLLITILIFLLHATLEARTTEQLEIGSWPLSAFSLG